MDDRSLVVLSSLYDLLGLCYADNRKMTFIALAPQVAALIDAGKDNQ